MVPECAFVYPSGHHCRRIPRRGQTFCPAHLGHRPSTSPQVLTPHRPPAAIPPEDEDAFDRAMFAWVDHVNALPLADMLEALHETIAALEPVIERDGSASARYTFTRAMLAATAATERFLESNAVLLPPIPAAIAARPLHDLSQEQLLSICKMLSGDPS